MLARVKLLFMSLGVSVRPVVGNRQKSYMFMCFGWKQVIFHH